MVRSDFSAHSDHSARSIETIEGVTSASSIMQNRVCGLQSSLRGEFMQKIIARLKGFQKGEEGVTMIEYGLIAALIAVAAVATLTTVGTSLNSLFTNVNNHLGSGS